MIINLKDNSIYTDDGELIKTLQCGHNVAKQDLVAVDDNYIKCSLCQKNVYKTEGLSDCEIIDLYKKDPSICFVVKVNQENVSKVEAGKKLYLNEIGGTCRFLCLDCKNNTERLVFVTRDECNSYTQCQNCGKISPDKNFECCDVKNYSDKHPVFCDKCKSTNLLEVDILLG